MKTTTAFRAFEAARANRANDAKNFMVKSVNKDGSISRIAPTKISWQLDAFPAAHANEVAEPRQRVRTLAQHLLREAMASGLDPEDASAAAALATWSLLDRLHITRQRHGGPR